MKVFQLIGAGFLVALLACGSAIAAEVNFAMAPEGLVEMPSGIAAVVGVGFDAMTLEVLAFGFLFAVAILALAMSVAPPAAQRRHTPRGVFDSFNLAQEPPPD